jgi:hypothetical protein
MKLRDAIELWKMQVELLTTLLKLNKEHPKHELHEQELYRLLYELYGRIARASRATTKYILCANCKRPDVTKNEWHGILDQHNT